MLKNAVEILTKAGAREQAAPMWVVGGAVRDVLLARPFDDIDLIVAEDAEKISRDMARRLSVKSFPLDAERHIYRLMCDHQGQPWTIDISDFEGKSLEDDLARRDFTVNALAVPMAAFLATKVRTQDVIDIFGGKKDILRRRVRLTGAGVIQADPLRLLRAFRLCAELGFSLDAATRKAVAKSAKLLGRPAKERVREELLKILSTENAGKMFFEMDGAGILAGIFPESGPMRKTAANFYGKGGVWRHSLEALASFDRLMEELTFLFPRFHKDLRLHLDEKKSGFPRFAHLKLAVLLHDVGKPATETWDKGEVHFYGHDYVGSKLASKIAARLRFSQEENHSLALLVRAHMRPGNLAHQPALTDRAVYRFYRDLGGDAVGMLIVSLADHFTYLTERKRKNRKDPVYLTVLKMLSQFFLRRETVQPPKIVDGRILMKKLKIKEGPAVGKILEAVREAQSEGRLKTTEEAVAFAQKLIGNT